MATSTSAVSATVAARPSTMARNADGSANTGPRSRNSTPGSGKSGISLTSDSASATVVADTRQRFRLPEGRPDLPAGLVPRCCAFGLRVGTPDAAA